jgi:predicted site-specific integrase-resolvase
MPSFEKQFTLKEAGLLLHREPQTLIRWIKAERLKAVRLPSGHYLVPESEVLRLLQGIAPKAMQAF